VFPTVGISAAVKPKLKLQLHSPANVVPEMTRKGKFVMRPGKRGRERIGKEQCFVGDETKDRSFAEALKRRPSG
jgi:hypothetical protein